METMQRHVAQQMELMQTVLMRLLDTDASRQQQLCKPMTNGFSEACNAPPLIGGPFLATTAAPAFNLQSAQPQPAAAPSPAAASTPATGAQPAVGVQHVLTNPTYNLVHTPLIFGSLGGQYLASSAHAPPTMTATVAQQAAERPNHPPAYGSHPAPTNVSPNEQ
jgi:hypothetical protein